MSEGRCRSAGEIGYVSESRDTSFILSRTDDLRQVLQPPLHVRKDQGRLHGVLQTFSRRRRDGTRLSILTAFGGQPQTASQYEKENSEAQLRKHANNASLTGPIAANLSKDTNISRSTSVSSLSSSEVSDTVALCPSVKEGSFVYYQRKSAAVQKGGGRKFRPFSARNSDNSKLTEQLISRNRFRTTSKMSANGPYAGHRSPAKSTDSKYR